MKTEKKLLFPFQGIITKDKRISSLKNKFIRAQLLSHSNIFFSPINDSSMNALFLILAEFINTNYLSY